MSVKARAKTDDRRAKDRQNRNLSAAAYLRRGSSSKARGENSDENCFSFTHSIILLIIIGVLVYLLKNKVKLFSN